MSQTPIGMLHPLTLRHDVRVIKVRKQIVSIRESVLHRFEGLMMPHTKRFCCGALLVNSMLKKIAREFRLSGI